MLPQMVAPPNSLAPEVILLFLNAYNCALICTIQIINILSIFVMRSNTATVLLSIHSGKGDHFLLFTVFRHYVATTLIHLVSVLILQHYLLCLL